MSLDNSPWSPAEAPELQWSAAGEPRSSRFEDCYFSRDDGLEESRFVFLSGNNLPARFFADPGRCFTVAETGFGTGLNFLACWQAWRSLPEPHCRLHFLSVEQFPLRRAQLATALARWPQLAPLADELTACYPPPLRGEHRLLLDDGRVTLDLWFAPAAEALADWAESASGAVDAWFLDGFAPSRNVEMWGPELMRHAAIASRPGASFATFTAASAVRRNLQAAGFEVQRAPGFGSKRERLLGHLANPPPPTAPVQTPWHQPRHRPAQSDQALVIGGGLAGCLQANALARRGISVTVLECEDVAGAASGNRQGILYTRLSPRHNSLTDFALQAYSFASRLYGQLLREGDLRRGLDGDLCGCFHQAEAGPDMTYLARALTASDGLARVVEADEATQLLGVTQTGRGYWFDGAGWLEPAALCRQQLQHPLVKVRERCGTVTLNLDGTQWAASAQGKTLARAPIAVLCVGTALPAFAQTDHLPVRAIRGQTTEIPQLGELRGAFCHKGYVAPAAGGLHCIGATFDLDDPDPQPRPQDNARNLEQLACAVPAWGEALAAMDPLSLPARVGFRCASPDYLPIAGPVPDRQAMLETYAALRRNARQVVEATAPNLPGLYVSSAHGSRGLTSAPLCAELNASHICHEPLPLSSRLQRALSPARFLVRDLARGRV